jgi:hypothetical protein
MGMLDNNPAHRMFGWTFKSLKIGGLTITNAKMQVVPDLTGTKERTMLTAGSRLQRHTDEFQPTVRIGMDVLRRLHLYIAAKEKKIYITAASGPVAPAAASTPARPAGEGTAN